MESINEELVQTARLNSSYRILRAVIVWVAIFVGAAIVFAGAAALKTSPLIRSVIRSALQLSESAAASDYSKLSPSLQSAHDKLELSKLFGSVQVLQAYAAKQAELKAQELELTLELNAARRNRDSASVEAAVNAINTNRTQLQSLSSSKALLSKYLSDQEDVRRREVETKESVLVAAYYFVIVLITVMLVVLLIAVYQALVCIIDISDCQVEIFARTKQATSGAPAAPKVSPLKYGL